MADGTGVTGAGASGAGKGGMWAGIGILAAVALVCSVARFIAIGATYPAAGMPRSVGEMIGGALPSFVIGLVAFFIVHFARRKSADRFAGVLSGLIVVVALAGLGYLGDLNHVAP